MSLNTENIVDFDSITPDTVDSFEALPAVGTDVPTLEAAKQPRNQHLKVANPKNQQFTARCTEQDYQAIKSAMVANGCRDLVELMLFSMNLHRNDFLSSFKF